MIIGGTVQNVTVNGSISCNENAVAGIVGNIKNGLVKNCINNASVSGDSGMQHAGIAANCSNTTIQACKNFGSIRGRCLVGGIAGEVFNNSSILGCINSKDVTACGTRIQNFWDDISINMCNVGGICGALWDNSIISSSYNESIITTSTALDTSGYICLGGISGLMSQSSTIEKSSNKGQIIYKGKSGIIGGVVGYSVESTINQCYNTNIIKGNYITKQTSAGGIVGWYDGSTVKNCYNIAGVEGGTFSGGIAGGADSKQTNKKSYIYNCYSANTSILGSNIVGTFMGSLENMEIKNCIFITDTKYTGDERDNLTWTSWKFLTITEMKHYLPAL